MRIILSRTVRNRFHLVQADPKFTVHVHGTDQGLYRFYSWKSDVKIENNKVALEACFSKIFSLKICQAYVNLLDSRLGKSIDDTDNCKSYLFHYIEYLWNFKLFSIRVLCSGQTGLGTQNSITRFQVTFTRGVTSVPIVQSWSSRRSIVFT